jgi:hypothetical protein
MKTPQRFGKHVSISREKRTMHKMKIYIVNFPQTFPSLYFLSEKGSVRTPKHISLHKKTALKMVTGFAEFCRKKTARHADDIQMLSL